MIPQLSWEEEWRTCFEKEVDLWFILHNGYIWSHFAFEQLLVEISFLILYPSRSFPWQVKQEWTQVVDLGRALSQMSQSGDFWIRDYLRKLWYMLRSFFGLWWSVVHPLLHHSSSRLIWSQDAKGLKWCIVGRTRRQNPFQAGLYQGPSLYTFSMPKLSKSEHPRSEYW